MSKKHFEFANELKIVNDIPLPSIVEISNSGVCNRSCVFCPRSDKDYPNKFEFVKTELIEKLSNELKEFDYSGLIIFSGFGEPTLDKNLNNHISILKTNLPNCTIEVISNGDALDLQKVKQLFDSGLSRLLISVYDGKERMEYFESMKKEISGYLEPRVRYLPPEQKFGLEFLTNRSGRMENAIYRIPSTEPSINNPCYFTSYMFFMTYTGDVLLCSNDWNENGNVGNFNQQSLMEIWTGDKMRSYRNKLINGDRQSLPCSKCDTIGTLMGLEHSKVWKNYYEKDWVNTK